MVDKIYTNYFYKLKEVKDVKDDEKYMDKS